MSDENESFKKTRTSPRINVINEVQALMVPHMDAIEVLLTRSDNDLLAEETTLSTLVREHLTAIRVGVETLRAGHPKTDKDDTTATSTPKRGGGTHFVGVAGDGKVMYLHRDRDGVYHGDDDHRDTISHIYGPFNTADGARFAAKNNTYTNRPQVQ